MLRRSPSLALRAALLFVSIYVVTFLAGLALLSAASLRVGGESHHAGPNIALTFAADDMRLTPKGLAFPADGPFARLASRNPSLWVLAEADGRRWSFGSVPNGAYPLFDRYAGAIESAKFHVPGVSRPLSDASAARRETESGSVLVATGGIDPATIGFGDSFRFFLSEGFFVILLALGAVGLIAMLVALPLLTASLKPVTADAAAIRPDRPDRRIQEDRVPRELLPLVRGFNAALDRLASELERRRRFIADVAHELRTPLAILSLQVDSLEASESKEDLQRVAARLSNLVAQMLDVERLSLAGQHRSPIDLASLAADVIADMAPMAAGYELSLAAPSQPVRVSGDPQALGRALGNLIGNAIAHAGGKGAIRVTVGEDRTIDVSDEGPGIAGSIRDSLFEPFCRERWDRDGCGLGLHLTREIMRAHGGDALLLPSERGALLRLEFD